MHTIKWWIKIVIQYNNAQSNADIKLHTPLLKCTTEKVAVFILLFFFFDDNKSIFLLKQEIFQLYT